MVLVVLVSSCCSVVVTNVVLLVAAQVAVDWNIVSIVVTTGDLHAMRRFGEVELACLSRVHKPWQSPGMHALSPKWFNFYGFKSEEVTR